MKWTRPNHYSPVHEPSHANAVTRGVAFALFPTDLSDGTTVWLTTYEFVKEDGLSLIAGYWSHILARHPHDDAPSTEPVEPQRIAPVSSPYRYYGAYR